MKLKRFITIALAGQMCGCATIVSDDEYPVGFSSDPQGAHVLITDENDQQVHRGETPFSVSLVAGDGYFDAMDYTARFEKPCYKSEEVAIESNLDEWYWGNLVFGGLLGFLIIDPATGDMWELDEKVHVGLLQTPDVICTDQSDAFGIPFLFGQGIFSQKVKLTAWPRPVSKRLLMNQQG